MSKDFTDDPNTKRRSNGTQDAPLHPDVQALVEEFVREKSVPLMAAAKKARERLEREHPDARGR